MNKKITGKESIHEILEMDERTADVMRACDLHCVGCPMTMQESLEDGCKAHGIEPKKVVDKINKMLGEKY